MWDLSRNEVIFGYQEINQDETLPNGYSQGISLGPISALPLTGYLILFKLLNF